MFSLCWTPFWVCTRQTYSCWSHSSKKKQIKNTLHVCSTIRANLLAQKIVCHVFRAERRAKFLKYIVCRITFRITWEHSLKVSSFP